MRAESAWVGTAIGLSVGTLGWVVGLGDVIWPAHPEWTLLLIAVAVSIVSIVILEGNEQSAHGASGQRLE